MCSMFTIVLVVVGVMLGDYGFFSFPMVDFSCWRKVTELPPSSLCLLLFGAPCVQQPPFFRSGEWWVRPFSSFAFL